MTFVLACSLIGASSPCAAQRHPNFSGEWARISGATDTPTELVIQHGEKVLRVERRVGGQTRTISRELGIIGGIVGATGSTITGVSWFGEMLLIDDGPSGESWSLDRDGQLVIEFKTRDVDGDRVTTTAIYRRVPPP